MKRHIVNWIYVLAVLVPLLSAMFYDEGSFNWEVS